MSLSLKQDLKQGLDESAGVKPCPVCILIDGVRDADTRAMLTSAAGGSMGLNKLAKILRRHEMGVSERSIRRHRQEGHLL